MSDYENDDFSQNTHSEVVRTTGILAALSVVQLALGRKDDCPRPGRGNPPFPTARARTEGVPPGLYPKSIGIVLLVSTWSAIRSGPAGPSPPLGTKHFAS